MLILVVQKIKKDKLRSILLCMCFNLFFISNILGSNTISINAENESLVTIFYEIESQSSYRFFYKNNEIDLDQKITLVIESIVIESLLSKLFEGRAINYKIRENRIILKKDKNVLYTIKGLLLDKDTREPIINSHLSLDGYENGSVTSKDGFFEVTFNTLPIHLNLSHINYGNHIIQINQLSEVTIAIPSKVNQLETVSLTSNKKDEEVHKMDKLLKRKKAFNGGNIVIITPTKDAQFSEIQYHWDKKRKEFTILTQVEKKQ